jgi:hypothetical protein
MKYTSAAAFPGHARGQRDTHRGAWLATTE